MKSEKIQLAIAISLSVIATTLVLGSIYTLLNNKNPEIIAPQEFENEETELTPEQKPTPKEPIIDLSGNFQFVQLSQTYFGKLRVKGYLEFKQVPAPFCEENCPTTTQAFVKIVESENKFLNSYLANEAGNSFVGNRSFGIGCIEGNTIWRMNDSDEFGMKKYTTANTEYQALVNTTPNNPAIIELERFKFTSGSGAPECYSHFANVRVIQ